MDAIDLNEKIAAHVTSMGSSITVRLKYKNTSAEVPAGDPMVEGLHNYLKTALADDDDLKSDLTLQPLRYTRGMSPIAFNLREEVDSATLQQLIGAMVKEGFDCNFDVEQARHHPKGKITVTAEVDPARMERAFDAALDFADYGHPARFGAFLYNQLTVPALDLRENARRFLEANKIVVSAHGGQTALVDQMVETAKMFAAAEEALQQKQR